MDRTQFLETLRSQLIGQMHEGKVAAHVRYYEDYIQSQVRGGRSEAEVLAQLGDPRLIAKTLLDTDADYGGEVYEDEQSYSGRGAYSDSESGQGRVDRRSYKLDLSTWYGKAIVIVIAVAAIIALVTIIGAVLPFFIILGIILFVISRLRRM
ncbi:DUF1700 domain-containing protein [Blautia schinkii]|nr:DUF1700 domain-containing protein [Blautia schinkii]